METEKYLPLVGRSIKSRSEAERFFGWGAEASGDSVPHPKIASQFSTSPQGGGADVVSLARLWIGTPYVHQASVRGAGCDCLGLLRGVWREMGRDEPETLPNYAPDWGGAGRAETLYMGLARHFAETPISGLKPGDIALFRMVPRAPARHCGIVAENEGRATLIHARQNKRVSEEPLSAFWRRKLVHAFRI